MSNLFIENWCSVSASEREDLINKKSSLLVLVENTEDNGGHYVFNNAFSVELNEEIGWDEKAVVGIWKEKGTRYYTSFEGCIFSRGVDCYLRREI